MAWAPDYTTVAALRRVAGIPATDTADDLDLALAVSAGARTCDLVTGRQFGQVAAAEDRYYRWAWDRRLGAWVAEIDDLMTTTDLVVTIDQANSTTTTDYTLAPRNAPKLGSPWTTIELGVAPVDDWLLMSAIWGWSSVPPTIERANLLQSLRYWKRDDAPFGVAGSATEGSEMRLLEKADPDVRLMLQPYHRPKVE